MKRKKCILISDEVTEVNELGHSRQAALVIFLLQIYKPHSRFNIQTPLLDPPGSIPLFPPSNTFPSSYLKPPAAGTGQALAQAWYITSCKAASVFYTSLFMRVPLCDPS